MEFAGPPLSPAQIRWIDRHLSIEDGRACIGKVLWDTDHEHRVDLQGTPAEVRHFLESIVTDYVPSGALAAQQPQPTAINLKSVGLYQGLLLMPFYFMRLLTALNMKIYQ